MNENHLDYFDFHYPHVQKVISTEGRPLTKAVCDKVVSCHSPFSINIWLYASNAKLHRTITRANNFECILEQIKYLLNISRGHGNICVNLGFIANNLTIEDLLDFLRLAYEMKINKVTVRYNTIYYKAQKYLSCFFNQELTNIIFDQTQDLAKSFNMDFDLPHKFGFDGEFEAVKCHAPWSQIGINALGYLISCNGKAIDDLSFKNFDYKYLWNSYYYKTLRSQFLEECKIECFENCHQSNPKSINNFISHVFVDDQEESIDLLWGDNF